MRVLLLVCSSACGRDSATVASCWNGRERPHELFGRLKAEKVGSLPPVLVVRTLVVSQLAICICSFFSGVDLQMVKTLVQAVFKGVKSTFFTSR
jgi:hypothetical protein